MSRGGTSGPVVSDALLADTRVTKCRCEDMPFMQKKGLGFLYPGIPVADLRLLREGCQSTYICPRLDRLRRRLGA